MSDWKLAPVEPTPEMIAAAFVGKVETQDVLGQMRRRQAMATDYKAMIAAAPTPESRGTDDELVDALTASQMDVQCLEASLQDARRELIEQYHVAERLQSEVKRMAEERDMLGEAIGEAAVKAGITRPGIPLTGPQLTMICQHLSELAVIAQGKAAPKTPEEVIALIGINYDSMEPVDETGRPLGDLGSVRYSLTVHDLISALYPRECLMDSLHAAAERDEP